ncbi:unnamed protein product [Parnassius apollo]|uniref:(apollo) hypothetical protein n=1 Tax=Parnassius apollo TaxID=110799 RepID=A0A8S3X3W2_PARAO|nr:unnamed protein product [Parnassius apollo]
MKTVPQHLTQPFGARAEGNPKRITSILSGKKSFSSHGKRKMCLFDMPICHRHTKTRIAKVKKKLFEDDKISENDNKEDTPNTNIVKINKKFFERQRETKKIPVSLNENDCLLIPLNMPSDEMLIPSAELPNLNEFPNVNENSY